MLAEFSKHMQRVTPRDNQCSLIVLILCCATELSLSAARALMDRKHYGLDKVKTRIVQYLAVRRLRGPNARGPILCFAGPPGVGKTSLARSVAEVRGARHAVRLWLRS